MNAQPSDRLGPTDALAAMRAEYSDAGLDLRDLAADWQTQLRRWVDDAVAAGLVEPNAMVVATATTAGVPSSRTVLAKAVDDRGVVFYSNYTSAKSHDLDTNPVVAATIPWVPISRQVHLKGTIERVDPAITEEYWVTRPRMSQLGAWASPQSTVVADRAALDELMERTIRTFGGPESDHPIPVPPFWGGWRIVPHSVEFWQGRTARMHDRLRYRDDGGRWVTERLAP